MIGEYKLQLIPPASPASVGVYGLRITEESRFELVCQVLAHTPEERDWRSEWNAVEGRVVADGKRLTFHVERGQREIRSCAWSGHGVEDDYLPMPSFPGVMTNDGVSITYCGKIALRRCDAAPLVRGLLLPDYEFS